MRKISLSHNAIPKTARKAIAEVFDSGQYSPGPKVREFEQEFAKLHKASYGVFVNSGTDALRMALLAMKQKYQWPDKSVILVPSVTFVATVNVVLQAGLIPKLVDVSNGSYTLNPYLTELAMIRGVVGVIPVHLFGNACEKVIFELARQKGVRVIEDSCETILNPLWGDVSCYSTYMAHYVTTGVGGMAVTNDGELNAGMRSISNHGRDAGYLPGYKTTVQGRQLLERRFLFTSQGYSSRGTEFEAALGLSQLPEISKQVEKRREVGGKIFKALSELGIFQMPVITEEHTLMMYPIVIKDGEIDKYDLCWHLEKHGIETRDMMPIVGQPCYNWIQKHDYPVAVHLGKKGFYIPCHAGMTDEDVGYIQEVFKSYLQNR